MIAHSQLQTSERAAHIGSLKERLARLGKELPFGTRLTRGLAQGVMSAIAALVAYVPTQVLGLREGFWAAITALAVTQTEFGATRSGARDQFAGAGIGAAIGLAMSLVFGSHPTSYAAAVIIAISICWLVNVGTAGRLSAITATIVLLVPHAGSIERMALSRIGEVTWGVCTATVCRKLMRRPDRLSRVPPQA